MGCCLIHESLNKANKMFKMYSVEFCFLHCVINWYSVGSYLRAYEYPFPKQVLIRWLKHPLIILTYINYYNSGCKIVALWCYHSTYISFSCKKSFLFHSSIFSITLDSWIPFCIIQCVRIPCYHSSLCCSNWISWKEKILSLIAPSHPLSPQSQSCEGSLADPSYSLLTFIPDREIWEVTQKDLELYHDAPFHAELLEGWGHSSSWLCPQHPAWYLAGSRCSLIIVKAAQEWLLQPSTKQRLKISDNLY